ncbi:hypothetical protein RQP53_04995 [Paucibacter sp. APW11]|uniref:Uncharacterized protein n=1 Tax=Roseateles aquae TaxID=3077235 RepID=A0ABU3P7V3_9BURK|nr:hypothetical protein [Paucibacter sp. APW11]MDT8998624.1 hypothetical protein [Paucibacter sp. APW11]
MNYFWMAAAVLLVLVGLVHSLLGERRIFAPHRAAGRVVPYAAGHRLGVQWVSWHLTALLGWVMAAALWERGSAGLPLSAADQHLGLELTLALLAGAAGLAGATAGRHLGWLGLAAAALLTLAGVTLG